ncbi:MAG: hypothetical protein PQJ59_10275 [Spirochaetales bacterium]|nr:hypothetical protein [Spirochaetales bacterium]
MTGQEKVLSYALERVKEKLADWFPEEKVGLYEGGEEEGLYLSVTGLEEDGLSNPMETLRVTVKDEDGEEVEVQVPAPRMVNLHFAVVPRFGDPLRSLDLSALVKRNIHDNPYLLLEECLWHGFREGKVMMEFSEGRGTLPGELSEGEPFRWDFSLRLGINSARIDKVIKVRERQFTAVKK